MAILTSCWFIIENVIIPDGLRKWFYLSFFIHPLILFLCQIFLWLKLAKHCLLVVLYFPVRLSFGSCLYVFGLFRNSFIYLISLIRRKKRATRVQEEVVEHYFEARQTFDLNQISDLYLTPSEPSPQLLEFSGDRREPGSYLYLRDAASTYENSFSGTDSFTTDETLDEFLHQSQSDFEQPMFYGGEFTIKREFLYGGLNSFQSTDEHSGVEFLPLCPSDSQDMNDYSSSFRLVEKETLIGDEQEEEEEEEEDHDDEEEEESDRFYKTYSERMRWFDVLNYDRSCGISAIEKNRNETPSPFRNNISWAKMTTKRLLRSLENDFELVYVAQSCLSWKALHQQYMKVKAIESSTSQNSLFCSYVAAEFQKFHILLYRFMEDEFQGKRVWNYVNGRFSLKGLLQVPQVSVKGLVKEDKENKKGDGTNIGGVLKVIEDCIEAFWLFVKTDNKKTWWQLKTSLWAYPPVEDPRDLQLLVDLTKRLQKNKLWLKDLEGKKRCLLKRIVNPIEESQRKEMLFTMIDMKLISRVLEMSIISSPQLKWCQEKLDNVKFKDGNVFRASTDPLFPP